MRLVSEAAHSMHREYLRTLKLKHSVFEKSYPVLSGVPIDNYKVLNSIPRTEREELCILKGEILAHTLYFSCFCEPCRTAVALGGWREGYTELKYRILCDSLCSDGFLLLFEGGGGRVEHYVGQSYQRFFERHNPLLALDLCEHAYFYDYGFDKESYVRRAVSMIDFIKK